MLSKQQKYSIASTVACSGEQYTIQRIRNYGESNSTKEAIAFIERISPYFNGKYNGYVPPKVIELCNQ